MGFAFLPSAFLAVIAVERVVGECLKDPELNAYFVNQTGGPIPQEGSCCMSDVCNLPCPEEVSDPDAGFTAAVIVAIVISFLIGLATYFIVHGQAVNFFVAGRSLPLWVVTLTLGAQSIDSNALLGNADLSYKFHFYDGAVIPIGLGLSLILNGVFLATHINGEDVLTLPDVYAKRYGKIVEVLISCATLTSFLMLLAGNLLGMGVILAYLWGISEQSGIWITAVIVWVYTVSGGLFSVAYTDVVQGIFGWSGAFITAMYLIANEDPNAPPPSIGFDGYIYPDNIGDDGVCDMYQGVNCTYNPDLCCYNTALWCPSADNCTADNGAYPIGDQRTFPDQMLSYLALTPFPNAIFWNWCTIFILGFGNLAALDFQARCMAAKTPNTAALGCLIGGCTTFLIGIPFAYLGSIQRVYYGPDSVHAVFETDTCSELLGLPTCGQWVPDSTAFIKFLTHQAPGFLGGWCLIGIVAASMSTADGAILAMGTVFTHNIMRQFDHCFPDFITSQNLLFMARVSTIPFTVAAALIGANARSNSAAGATGYLLIVAFDIVLATAVVPLFGCFYTKKPSPAAAFVSVIVGALLRIILEFALPKDGFLLLPYKVPEFLDYGPGASTGVPLFVDAPPDDVWNPEEEPCVQRRYEDFTGVDSMTAFVTSAIVFVSIQFIENKLGRPLFHFRGMDPYEKVLDDDEDEDYYDEYAGKEKGVYGDQTEMTKGSKTAVEQSMELEEEVIEEEEYSEEEVEYEEEDVDEEEA